MRGFEFGTVRIVCHGCGWERVIGRTGQQHTRRALVRVARCEAACNLLSAQTREVPVEVDPFEWAARHPDYRDLEDEAYSKGLYPTMAEFRPLVGGRPCPRCGAAGRVELDVIHRPGVPIHY